MHRCDARGVTTRVTSHVTSLLAGSTALRGALVFWGGSGALAKVLGRDSISLSGLSAALGPADEEDVASGETTSSGVGGSGAGDGGGAGGGGSDVQSVARAMRPLGLYLLWQLRLMRAACASQHDAAIRVVASLLPYELCLNCAVDDALAPSLRRAFARLIHVAHVPAPPAMAPPVLLHAWPPRSRHLTESASPDASPDASLAALCALIELRLNDAHGAAPAGEKRSMAAWHAYAACYAVPMICCAVLCCARREARGWGACSHCGVDGQLWSVRQRRRGGKVNSSHLLSSPLRS